MSEKTHILGFEIFPKIINGGVAGIIGTSLMFPLDLAKVRIQGQVVGHSGVPMYKSLTDCLRQTVKLEGTRGLYRGYFMALVLITPERAVKLTTNDFVRYCLKVPDRSTLSLPREIIAGASAGLLQNIFTTPMDLVKIQMQDAGRLANVNKTPVKSLSAIDIAANQIKKNGIPGLYRGVEPSTYRNVLFSIIYFPVFFNVNARGPRSSANPKSAWWFWSFISGCFAASIAAAISTPFDVVKTRMQKIYLGIGETQYSGTLDAFIKIFKKEGPSVFMRGAGIRMLVIAPHSGISQTIYYLGVGEHLLGSVQRSEQ